MEIKKDNVIKKIRAFVGDSLQNVLTGMGIDGLDKSMASRFVETKLSFGELEAAYGSDWLSGKIIDLPPYDMTREWRKMTGDMSPEKKKAFLELEEELEIQKKIKEVKQWARLYGGAGLILNVEDGLDPSEPLDFKNIKKGTLKSIVVMDRQFLHLGHVDHNPLSSNYGYPETYRISQTSLQIHHTRVVRFDGVPLPLQARRQNNYWGKSVLERVHAALVRSAEAQENVGSMLHEATVDIIKIPELMSLISSPETEKELQKRFGVAKLQKSVNRMLLMDADEEYEQHQQTFAGIPDVLEKMLNIAAGAADIPITRLFGQSPGGMNSTGDSDLRNYYDNLAAQQNTDLTPLMKNIDLVMYGHLFGTAPDDNDLSFTWNRLWQMSEKEQAELENLNAERDQKYLAMNVVSESIIARDLVDNKVYSSIDLEYVKELEAVIDDMDDVNENEDEGEDDNGVVEEDNDEPEKTPNEKDDED